MFDALKHCVTAVDVLRTAVKIIAEHTMRESAESLKQENNGSVLILFYLLTVVDRKEDLHR